MISGDLVIGLLDTSQQFSDTTTAERLRDITLAWTRYGYQEELLEANDIDVLLHHAAMTDARYCFIIPHGYLLYERWRIDGETQRTDFFAALRAWTAEQRFLAASPCFNSEPADLTHHHCALIDLDAYRSLGMPAWESIREAGYEAGWPTLPLDDEILRFTSDLGANDAAVRAAMVPFFGSGIRDYAPQTSDGQLTADQRQLLSVIHTQTQHARSGVFLWNIESYDDIQQPPDGFVGPVSSLYSVAAGFKPNRILQTHGFDANSRVVFFDYSRPALAVRQHLVTHWDGWDFPQMVRELFARFPAPDVFYQLWNEVTPDQVTDADLQRMWQRELDRWGGATAFADHWDRYRSLKHEFVACDLLSQQQPLLDAMQDASGSIIWWSNAFFTMYGNWLYTVPDRHAAYEHWIGELAARNPRLFLLGSDDNNTCVNAIQADEYNARLQQTEFSSLRVNRFHRTEIRM
ncbi:MAG: hypothetical protein KDA92_19980 [Planctomycetales bacterium]|nr:hypothetical protein [Planctomycetales bacterium]